MGELCLGATSEGELGEDGVLSIPLNPLRKAPKIKEDGNHNDQDNDHHQQDIER